MKRGIGVALCLLLVGCAQEVDDVVVDETYTDIKDVVVCKGLRNKECNETVDKVQQRLPDELLESIIPTVGRIEVYVGSKDEFLNYMQDKRIHIDTIAYSGITGYGFEDKTIIYAMADDYILIHELAHAYEYSYWYDGTKDNPSTSEAWQRAYEEEYVSAYGTTSVIEFYAECFALYFRHPSGLKICCPMAYELLDAEFGEME
jgi:hypothetical protein